MPNRWICSRLRLRQTRVRAYRALLPRLALLPLLAVLGGCEPTPPAGHLQDDAQLFSADQQARLNQFHAYLLADHDIDYQVVTSRSDDDITRLTLALFKARHTGSRSQTGRGLLLLINPRQQLVRLEVSAALEPVYVDGFIAYLEQRQMLPFFAHQRVADGILAATEMIVTRAQNAERNRSFSDEAWAAVTLGGGATASLQQAAPQPEAAPPEPPPPLQTADDSPRQVVHRYLTAMAERNAAPALALYSEATRAMLRDWVVTPAQMDNIVASYRNCPEIQIYSNAQHAVIAYPVEQRGCSPWFLVREGGAWRLDLATMQQVIRFGRSNAWRLAQRTGHPYAFAFSDWQFDRNGFPQHQRPTE